MIKATYQSTSAFLKNTFTRRLRVISYLGTICITLCPINISRWPNNLLNQRGIRRMNFNIRMFKIVNSIIEQEVGCFFLLLERATLEMIRFIAYLHGVGMLLNMDWFLRKKRFKISIKQDLMTILHCADQLFSQMCQISSIKLKCNVVFKIVANQDNIKEKTIIQRISVRWFLRT